MLTRIKFGWTSNGPLRINTCHTSYLSPFTVAAPQQKGISLHSYTRTIWNMLIGSIHQANASTRHHPHSLFLDSVRQPHHQRHCSSRLNKPTKYYRRFILDAWVFYLAASFEWDKPPASTVCLSPSAVSLSLSNMQTPSSYGMATKATTNKTVLRNYDRNWMHATNIYEYKNCDILMWLFLSICLCPKY